MALGFETPDLKSCELEVMRTDCNAPQNCVLWLRTNGVNTNGAAAKVMYFDGLGKKVRPATFGKINAS